MTHNFRLDARARCCAAVVAGVAGLASAQGEVTPLVFRSTDAFDRTVVRDRPLVVAPPRERPGWLTTREARTEGNGRVWRGPAVVGGMSAGALARWDQRERFEYGASREDDGRVVVFVTYEPVVFSPWGGLQGFEETTLEAARALWLRERGFTGGVRRVVRPSGGGERAAEGSVPSVRMWRSGGSGRGPVAGR